MSNNGRDQRERNTPVKTVFILGAGASRAANAPLMFDFIDSAIKIHRRDEATWARQSFDQIVDARRKLQSAYVKSTIDLDNIENLFATCEMASLIGRLADLDAKTVGELPRHLRYLIMRTLEQSILFPINGRDRFISPPYPYGAFAELLFRMQAVRDVAPIAVINFNYDLCLDYAISSNARSLDYGLEFQEALPNSIPHYKVHGSLNWFRNSQGDAIAPQPLQALPMRTYWDRLGLDRAAERPIDTMELLHGPERWGDGLHPEPVIVPPTWNKGWYQEQLKSVWRRASAALATAENIFVIGYSMPPSDQFFRAFWSLSTISESVIERFWLFDPSTNNELVDRYSSLLGPAIIDRGKFKFECLKFSGAIKLLAKEFLNATVENLTDR